MDRLTIESLREAVETRDDDALAGFYAKDAIIQIIDQDHPPSRPLEIKGRPAIDQYFRDLCGREMTHELVFGVADNSRLAFTQACAYPDGKRVLCSATLQLAGGKIARQVAVQAWDS